MGNEIHEVERALQEASQSRERALTLTDNPYQWEATLAAAGSSLQRAEGLASQDEAGLEAAVRERLQGLRVVLDADENDRRFATRFDEIRVAQTQMTEGGWFNKATAFHGTDDDIAGTTQHRPGVG